MASIADHLIEQHGVDGALEMVREGIGGPTPEERTLMPDDWVSMEIFFEIFEFPCGHLEVSKFTRAGGGPQSRSRVNHQRLCHVTQTGPRASSAPQPGTEPQERGSGATERQRAPGVPQSAANCTLAVRSYTRMFPGVFAVYSAV